MLTALTTGDSDDSRLVAPRAISAPGTTTTAAPYAADTRADPPADEPRHRHGDGAERRLRGDHAPGREHRMVAPEGLGLGTRHRRERGLIGVAIGIVEGCLRGRATVATGHRVEGGARHGDFQHSPRLYVETHPRRKPRAVIADAGRASDEGRAREHAIIAADRRCRMLSFASSAASASSSQRSRPLAVSAADPPAGAAPHHRDGRFQNNYLEFEPKGIAALLKWRMEAARAGLPKPPQHETPRVAAGPRLPARQRRRRRGDGAGADLDRPRQHADPGGRRQHPHRPDVLRARIAVRLRRAEAPRCRRGWRSPSCRTSTPSSSRTTTTTTSTRRA